MLNQKVRGKGHTEPVRVIKLLRSQQIVFLFLFFCRGSVFISHLGGASLVSLVFSHFISGSTHYYAVLRVLSGESQGRGSLLGYRLWGRTESDTTEAT